MEIAIIGILINLFGSVSTALGWAIQKIGHRSALANDTQFYKIGLWWFGLIFVIIAQPCYIISASMANQSTLGVVGPFSIIANVLFAYFMLNERISKYELIGVILFIPGIMLTLCFASKKNNRLNREEFNKVFYSKLSMIYLASNVLLITIMVIFSYYILKPHPDDEYKSFNDEPNELDNTPTNQDQEDTKKKLKKTERTMLGCSHWKAIPLLVYPYFGTFLAGISGTIIRFSFGFALTDPPHGYKSNFDGIMPKVYIVLIVVWSLWWYYVFNIGLKYYETIYMAPLFKIAGMINNLLCGGIFLNEFGDYSGKTTHLLFFITGIWIWIIGIAMLIIGNDVKECKKED